MNGYNTHNNPKETREARYRMFWDRHVLMNDVIKEGLAGIALALILLGVIWFCFASTPGM